MNENKLTMPVIRAKDIVKGAVLLLCYVAAFPLLTDGASLLLERMGKGPLSDSALLLIPYYASFLLAVLLFRRYLIENFEMFVHNLGHSLGSMLRSYGLMILVSLAVSVVLVALANDTVENPNDATVADLLGILEMPTVVISVLLGPLVEEIVFRGVVFGAVARKNVKLAYVVSWIAFSLPHLITYVISSGDWSVLVLLLQYLPPCIAWGWCYQRSGTIWTCIFMHMLYNGLSVYALQALQTLV